MYGTSGLIQIDDFILFINEIPYLLHVKQKLFLYFNLITALIFIFSGYF